MNTLSWDVAWLLSWLYVVANSLRVAFYIPQIRAIWLNRHATQSNSLLTWGYFSLSHWTGVLYFSLAQHDPLALFISLSNACVASVLFLLLYKINTKT
jgi:hypothetical protein